MPFCVAAFKWNWLVQDSLVFFVDWLWSKVCLQHFNFNFASCSLGIGSCAVQVGITRVWHACTCVLITYAVKWKCLLVEAFMTS